MRQRTLQQTAANDSVDEKGEMERQENVSMNCMSFQEYCDKILEVCGWLLVENLKKMKKMFSLLVLSKKIRAKRSFGTTAEGNRKTPKKFERLVQSSSESCIDECGKKLTCRSALTKMEEDQLAFDGLMLTRVSVCIEAG